MEGMSFADYERKVAELEATVERLSILAHPDNCRCDQCNYERETGLRKNRIAELKAENQKMAELLDRAPHAILCLFETHGGKCDCWKKEADALLSRESSKS